MGRMGIILILVILFLVLVFAEYLARTTVIHAELTRKFVHMTVGTFVAFWPFFISWRQIEMLSVASLVAILLSIRFNVLKSVHTIPRQTVGEVLFAMVIGFLALISSSKWIFMAAMLHLSLADGLAAVAGLGWGDSNQYKVFGRVKSIAGTTTFLVVSLVVMIIYVLGSGAAANITTLMVVPVIAAVTENAAIDGTDNLLMPMIVALILGSSN